VNYLFYVDGKRSDTLDTILSPMNEAYFGKSPELLAIEHKIGEVRYLYNTNFIKVNSSKEMRDLGRMFGDFFGFKEFYLAVDMTGSIDSYTYPISNMIGAGNPKKYVELSKNGYKYAKDAGYSIMIYLHKGLFFNDEFSDGEILAVILKEIGHNFQASLNNVSLGFSYVQRALTIVTLPFAIIDDVAHGSTKHTASLTKPTRDAFISILKDWREKHPELIVAYDVASNLVKTILGVAYVCSDLVKNVLNMFNPLNVFTNALEKVIKVVTKPKFLFGLPSYFVGFKNDTLADNFATVYGYGPELSRALKKKTDLDSGLVDRQIIRGTPLLGAYYDLLTLPSVLISDIIDSTPNNAFRVNDQIKFLKNELRNDKDMPPRMKADIEHQIKDIEETLRQVTDYKQRGFEFTNAARNLALIMFGGDWRGFLVTGNTKDFDKLYDYAETNSARKREFEKSSFARSAVSAVKMK
jgi:hypothetical protein